jgi:hypothetical protein
MGSKNSVAKVEWSGVILYAQPRIRLLRSFDEVHHSYLGYVLCIEGLVGDEQRRALIAIGKAAQLKNGFQRGMMISGKSVPVENTKNEVAEYYKTSALRVLSADDQRSSAKEPPYFFSPMELAEYRERGHRRLSAKSYSGKCFGCAWGCKMPVEITIDHWKPSMKRYRTETFCYGPLSCEYYTPGPKRVVPGRNGMSYTEEDWVDEQNTAHRQPDE